MAPQLAQTQSSQWLVAQRLPNTGGKRKAADQPAGEGRPAATPAKKLRVVRPPGSAQARRDENVSHNVQPQVRSLLRVHVCCLARC